MDYITPTLQVWLHWISPPVPCVREYCICLCKFPICRLVLRNTSVSNSPGDSFSWLLYGILAFIFLFALICPSEGFVVQEELLLWHIWTCMVFVGKQGQTSAGSFTLNLQASAHTKKRKKKQTGKRSSKKSAAGLKAIQATVTCMHYLSHAFTCQNELIGILTLMRNSDKKLYCSGDCYTWYTSLTLSWTEN